MKGTDRPTPRNPLKSSDSPIPPRSSPPSGDDTYPSAARLGYARRARVTQAELSLIAGRLSGRDQALLVTLKTFRLATVLQLQAIHFAGHASDVTARRLTRKVLTRLREQGLVERLERRIGGLKGGSAGHIYQLAPLGHRVLGNPTRKRSNEPSLHHVDHTLAITGVAARLHAWQNHGGGEIEVLEAEPTCWRSDPNSLLSTLKPDLYAQLSDASYELRWFIEVDLGTESSKVLARKLSAYTSYWRSRIEQEAHGFFPAIIWLADDERRAAFIERTIAETKHIEPRLFTVRLLDAAEDELTRFD